MARFSLYVVVNANKGKVPVTAKKATAQDLSVTTADPKRQTDWTDDYITESGFDLYAFHTREGELVTLGAYELDENSVVVHIIYMESQAESNKTLVSTPKYLGIGRALVAFGIKLSVDAGHNGDVTLGAKTPELAVHYERDFGAIRLPGRSSAVAPRYLICDEAAMDIFTCYLKEG